MRRAVVLFTRALAKDCGKSRMGHALSCEQRAALQHAFISDLAASIMKAQSQRDDITIIPCSTTEDIPAELEAAFAGSNHRYLQQRGDSFRERIVNVFADVLAQGFDSCVMLGSDCVEASAQDILDAFDILEECPTVFGPSDDGGFYLAGLSAAHPELFDIDGYGTCLALRNVMQHAGELGLGCAMLRPCSDMDTLFDLQRLYARAQHAGEHGDVSTHIPSATVALLRELAEHGAPVDEHSISVIVPLYNEADVADKLANQLRDLALFAEIVLVDGGSTDGTVEYFEREFCIVRSSKGRGRQLNAGAAAAHGEGLFFLHADSELPEYPLEQIREVLAKYRAGCFGIRFPRSTIAMRCCQALSNFRASRRKIMFGDQGIFIERALFEELGGFREIALMEDYQLSLDLQQRRIPFGMCRERILTSDRRYRGDIIRQLVVMRKMAVLRKRYRGGEDPEQLARDYRDIR